MDPNLQSDYQYNQLSDKDIRLIDLKNSRNYVDTVECSIFNFPLADPPAYVALSYCWGSDRQSATMILDGVPVPITENLQRALRRLRWEGCTLVWVDAVCIDQRDHGERNFQVTRMSAIYSKARAVAVWLGPAADGSDTVMKALEASSSVATPHQYTSGSLPLLPDEAITAFLTREYWRRLWIIQEIARGTRVTIFCGNYRVEWEKFQMMFKYWTEHIDVHSDQIHSNQALAAILNLCEIRDEIDSQPTGLLRAMCRSRHSRCRDHRDKIYGILGLTFDGATFVPEPSYDISEADVCRSMSEAAIFKKRTLDYIFLASSQSILRPSACPHIANLPSWCADYLHLDDRPLYEQMVKYVDNRDERYRLNIKGKRWLATAGSTAVPQNVLFRNKVIRVRAWHVCDVDGLSTTFQSSEHGIYQSQSKLAKDWSTADAILRSLGMYFASYNGLKDTGIQLYGASSAWGMQVAKTFYKTGENLKLIDWMCANNELLINGRSFSDWRKFSFHVYGRGLFLGISQYPETISKIPTSAKEVKRVARELVHEYRQPNFYKSALEILNEGLRLMTTREGYIGWAHPSARPGDSVFLISGCTMPAILRKTSDPSRFTLVGHAYVDGVMDGRKWTDNASNSLKDIYIC